MITDARRPFLYAFSLLALYPLLVMPLSTFFAGPSGYQVSTTIVAVSFAGSALLLGLILNGLLIVISPRWREYLFSGLLLCCVVVFYHFNFHQYDGKVVGVHTDVFRKPVSWLDLLVYASATAGVCLAHRHIIADKVAIAFFFLAANVVLLGTQIFTTRGDSNTFDTVLQQSTLDGLWELSPERNVLHIVLDGFEGTLFREILTGQRTLETAFSGFTFFPDATTTSEVTYLSLPALLSGVPFTGSMPISEYRKKTGFGDPESAQLNATPPLMARLAEADYRIDVLAAPGGRMPPSNAYTTYVRTDAFNGSDSSVHELFRIADVTLARAMPWGLKAKVYGNGNWLLSRLAKDDETSPRANRAMEFIRVFGSRIVVGSSAPTYKFLHLITPHGPWTTDHNCAATDAGIDSVASYVQTQCTVIALQVLLDQLRAIGLYDETAILIHGDHGMAQGIGLPEGGDGSSLPRYTGNANPLVLIKPFGAHEPLSVSSREIQLLDIPATIAEMLGLRSGFPGRSMLATEDNASIERLFFEFQPNRVVAAKLDRVDEVKRFAISGPIYSPNSWTMSVEDRRIGAELDKGVLLDVVRSSVNQNNVMWVTWTGPPPARGLFAEVDGEAVPVSVNPDKRFLSFSLGERRDTHELFLVDPETRMKQQLRNPEH